MRTLHAKLSAVLLVLLLVVGAATAGLTVRTSRLYLQEVQQKLHRDLAAKVLEDQPLLEDVAARDEMLHQIFEKLMLINPDIEVYLLDADGGVLGYSAPPGAVQLESVELAPVRAFLAGEAPLPIKSTNPRDPGAPTIFSAAPIHDPPSGYLYIVLQSEQLGSVATMVAGSYILTSGVAMVAGTLAAALLGGLLLFRRLTQRLRRLAGDMETFETEMAGPAIDDGREPSPSADEVDALERRFVDMSARIAAQLTALEERDQERRELLANISHDVRTPLTHLQGYLETMQMKGETISEAERDEYLHIAVQRSEQLGRLVGDLLDLARLDAPEAALRKETFSIGELVQDVAQEFRLVAAERSVDLDVHIEAADARVRGNVGTLERVLQNLIENAVRYTRGGDRIDVRVERYGDFVRVAVRDTGPGIPPDELEFIFDRFYRCRARAAGSQEGSGLGLSIAQRALHLHGADLACDSELGEGTTFHFALACAAG